MKFLVKRAEIGIATTMLIMLKDFWTCFIIHLSHFMAQTQVNSEAFLKWSIHNDSDMKTCLTLYGISFARIFFFNQYSFLTPTLS